jgi:hypothetical protein
MKQETEPIHQTISFPMEGTRRSLCFYQHNGVEWCANSFTETLPVYEALIPMPAPRNSPYTGHNPPQCISARPISLSANRFGDSRFPSEREVHGILPRTVPLNLLGREAAIVACARCGSCEKSTIFLCSGHRTQ